MAVNHTETCPYCGRSGFVRFEHVIAKGEESRHFYCGACDRTWKRSGQQDEPPRSPDPPPAKRR